MEKVKKETGYSFNPYEKRGAESFAVKQSENSAMAKRLARLKQESTRLKEKLSLAESKVQHVTTTLTPTLTEKQA